MKQFKKMKKVWAFLLALVMVLSVIPADAAWAADKYAIKRGCAKEGVFFAPDGGGILCVSIYKNGKDISRNEKESKQVKWKSSNASVASVYYAEGTSAGVAAKKQGTATITATYRGKSVSFKITVKGATFTVGNTTGSKGYVAVGQSLRFDLRGDGWDELNGSDAVQYSSSNSKVAKVAGSVIRGLKEGSATITAKSKSGTVKCTVTVLPALKLQVKDVESIKKNGEIVAFSCNIVNKGKKPVTILEVGDWFFYEAPAIGKIKGGSVVIKPGKSKTITVMRAYVDSEGVGIDRIALSVKYEGHKFYGTYDDGFDDPYMGTWSESFNAISEGGAG